HRRGRPGGRRGPGERDRLARDRPAPARLRSRAAGLRPQRLQGTADIDLRRARGQGGASVNRRGVTCGINYSIEVSGMEAWQQREPEINKLFRMVRKHQGSNLYLRVGSAPSMRRRGVTREADMRPLSQQDLEC